MKPKLLKFCPRKLILYHIICMITIKKLRNLEDEISYLGFMDELWKVRKISGMAIGLLIAS